MSRSVAILGGTGHVARVLIDALAGCAELSVYARRPEAAVAFVNALPNREDVEVVALSELGHRFHDALVNCIGVGDPGAWATDPSLVYEATHHADDCVVGYLESNPACRVISMSSGAVYCSDFTRPAHGQERASVRLEPLDAADHYALAKLASEGRHRALSEAHIIDLRLFSLFSRHIDPTAAYFMNDVVRAVLTGSTLTTGPCDFVRDYVAPRDLASLVTACVSAPARNVAMDVYSSAPARKSDILTAFEEHFGLQYRIDDALPAPSKIHYYSDDRRAAVEVGYSPTMTSLETLLEECSAILRMRDAGRPAGRATKERA